MIKNIEVYFKNENDAKSAEAELRTLKLKDIYVEEMPEDSKPTSFIPLIPRSMDSGVAATGGVGSVTPFIPSKEAESPGPNYPPYLLHVELEGEDWDKAMEILQEHDCYTSEES